MTSSQNRNKIYDLIMSHSSVRSYLDKKIPDDILQRILNAATMASSSGNMQAYSIIVTTDSSIKKQLLAPHFFQTMTTDAPVLLTFCADFHRMRKWLKLNEAPENFDNLMSFMIASIDAILASQNAALVAESEGLGICYMGTTLASKAEITDILKCPKHVVPVVGFSLGYPKEIPSKKDRLPLMGVVHRDTYSDYDDESISKIYSQKEDQGFKRYLDDPDLKKIVAHRGI